MKIIAYEQLNSLSQKKKGKSTLSLVILLETFPWIQYLI